MKIGEKQRKFTRAIGKLISMAYANGYELTFGDAYRDPRVFGRYGEKREYSHQRSLHKLRLAVDFNVFVAGHYLEGEDAIKAHNELHNYWDSIGGAPRITGDLNHYSFSHDGII